MQLITEREGWCPKCGTGPIKLENLDRMPEHGECGGRGMLAQSPRPSKNTRGKREPPRADAPETRLPGI